MEVSLKKPATKEGRVKYFMYKTGVTKKEDSRKGEGMPDYFYCLECKADIATLYTVLVTLKWKTLLVNVFFLS